MKVVNARNVTVEVPLPLGGSAIVEPGGELSTSDDHAKSLLAQPINWKAAPASQPSTSKESDK